MFSESADLYDVVYRSFKDYAAEADGIAAIIKGPRPDARSVLDVGCGTGEHAMYLRERHGLDVDGIDISADMVRIATAKNPRGTFTTADMTDFDLAQQYDAVICMFSSIGYVKTIDRLQRTVARMAAQAKPDGIVVVEPWFPPGKLDDGNTHIKLVETDDIKVVRANHITIDGTISRMVFEYIVARKSGLEHFTELHEMGLFTVDEMKAAFAAAGLAVEYDAEGPTGRGLYVGTLQ